MRDTPGAAGPRQGKVANAPAPSRHQAASKREPISARTLRPKPPTCYRFRVPGSYVLPPLVEAAARGRLLRGALWAAALVGAALGAVMIAQEPGVARAETFAAAFVESAVRGTELHRAAVDAAGAREVEAARAWMVPKYRVLSCQAVGFALAPSPGQHECIVRFANGALAHLDIAEEGGRMRVVAFSSAPPGAPAP